MLIYNAIREYSNIYRVMVFVDENGNPVTWPDECIIIQEKTNRMGVCAGAVIPMSEANSDSPYYLRCGDRLIQIEEGTCEECEA